MTCIPGIPEPYSGRILALFSNLPLQTQVVLFGSRAKGNFREGSDIDIALKEKSLTETDRARLLAAYEELYLPWKLDLVIYDAIQEPALREHIDRVGIALCL